MAEKDWHDLMKRGRFEEAWAICDRDIRERRGNGHLLHHGPRHLQNIWDGTPLAGRRVLIRCYHGLGDSLQFVRYVPMVRDIAAETTLWIQSALVELVRPSLPGVRLLPLDDGAPPVSFDVDIEIMELPHAFRTTLATIPASALQPVPTGERQRNTAIVGLQWTAGNWDEDRSVPFDEIESLLTTPGVSFVPLKERLDACERERFTPTPPVDLVGMARRVAACDLVISVDTMVAHLSGSLHVPTWTLLKHDADWRWLADCSDTPWYPSMRLYRQSARRRWRPVISRVLEDLTRLFRRLER